MSINKDSMSYEQRRAIEEQENRDRDARQSKLLAEVATYLPQGWVFKDRDRSDTHRPWYFINSSINGSIWVSQEWNAKEKLNISGNYPRDRQGKSYDTYESNRPSISFSASRTALAIAKDIERRFLPDYLALLVKIKTRIAEHEAYLDRKVGMGAELSVALPFMKLDDSTQGKDWHGNDKNGSTVSLKCDWASIECFDTYRGSLDLNNLTMNEIIAVMQMLKESRS